MIPRLPNLFCVVFAGFVFAEIVQGQKFESLSATFDRKKPKCERITVEHCASIGYNETRFPNFAGDENAEAAASTLSSFSPLIGTNCNAEIAFFLCSVYFPMCTEKVPDPIGPCRGLCLRIQKDCAPLLNEFKFVWPPALECNKFPVDNTADHLCMPGLINSGPENDEEDIDKFESPVPVNSNRQLTNHPTIDGRCSLKDWTYVNRTAQCVPKCSTNSELTLAEIMAIRQTLIVGSMASVCFTTICVVAACVRGGIPLSGRRPIDKSLFFCALCFCICSVFYALSLLFRHNIACTEYNNTLLYAVRGFANTKCTFVATIIYYFGSAGRMWCLMLCIAWRWNLREHSLAEMEKFVFRAHIICWAVPLFLVTMALMAQSVNPELVSGICVVGAASHPQYQMFVALREFLIMLACVLVLSSGCLNSVHHSSRPITASSMPSAGIIGVLYPLAACFMLISSLQAHYNPISRWMPLASFQLLADLSLGTLIGAAYFVYILYFCFHSGSVPLEKNGYIPAATVQVTSNGRGLTGTTTTCVTGPQMTPNSLYHQVTAGVPTSIGTYYSTGGIMAPPPSNLSPPEVPQVPVPPVPHL